MFRAEYRSSSGAPNCICSLWFIYLCGDRPTQPGQRPVTTWIYKQDAANTVWSSWWWAVCRSKHVESSINFGIINSITRLHLVGYFYWLTLAILTGFMVFFRVAQWNSGIASPLSQIVIHRTQWHERHAAWITCIDIKYNINVTIPWRWRYRTLSWDIPLVLVKSQNIK
jgi:hypothetical protein